MVDTTADQKKSCSRAEHAWIGSKASTVFVGVHSIIRATNTGTATVNEEALTTRFFLSAIVSESAPWCHSKS